MMSKLAFARRLNNAFWITMRAEKSGACVMIKPGSQIFLGWTYNPSSLRQRAPMIGLIV